MSKFNRRKFINALPVLIPGAALWSHGQERTGRSAALNPLYRVLFTYPEGWEIRLTGSGTESQSFFFAEGRCEGRIQGRFREANHPRRRSDGTYEPDFQGIIETEDGADVYFDYRGYGRAYPEGTGGRTVVADASLLLPRRRYGPPVYPCHAGACLPTGRGRQELPDHKSSKTTEIYTHVSTKSLQAIRSPFDDL